MVFFLYETFFSVVTYKVIEGVSDEDIEDLDSEVILVILLGCAFWPFNYYSSFMCLDMYSNL